MGAPNFEQKSVKKETTCVWDEEKKWNDFLYLYCERKFMNKLCIINHHVHGCLNEPMDARDGNLSLRVYFTMQDVTQYTTCSKKFDNICPFDLHE
jgi:hypothetical protein